MRLVIKLIDKLIGTLNNTTVVHHSFQNRPNNSSKSREIIGRDKFKSDFIRQFWAHCDHVSFLFWFPDYILTLIGTIWILWMWRINFYRKVMVNIDLATSEINAYLYRVETTESASAQFPTWIFNFGPYGQLTAVFLLKSCIIWQWKKNIHIKNLGSILVGGQNTGFLTSQVLYGTTPAEAKAL